MLIPKVVHVTWKSKDILNNQAPLILNGIRNIVDINQDWQLQLSDDVELESYLSKNLSRYDYNLLSSRHIVEKSDVWRLLKIYNEGGMYIDIDRLFNKKLNDIISPTAKCVLPTNNDFDFSQDLIISAPENPIYKEVLELNLLRRRQGINDIYFLGAQTYMHGVTKALFGTVIDTNPGSNVFEHIKKELGKIEFIQTYNEMLPNKTFVYEYDPTTYCEGNGKSKNEFYQEFDVKHWML
jgi:hypothetical protein